MTQTWRRFDVVELTRHVAHVFRAAGLDDDKAATTARYLVRTDMMGRPTHGVAQCEAYVREIASGGMTARGSPDVVRDQGSTLVWDGGYRPGLWLVDRALEVGVRRVRDHGTVTIALKKSHHIGCLAALCKTATDAGLFVIMASSGPHTKAVAPHGGKDALFSPNPFAVGIPTSHTAMLIDTTASATTVSTVREAVAAGTPLKQPWLIDRDGTPTHDATVLERSEARGAMLLFGGQDHGHKAFGLAILVEALTQGLSGHGRLDAPTRWGASVFIQLIDPAAFAGRDAFVAQMDFFAEQCRSSAPLDPQVPVRMPGDQAARLLADAEANGVPLSPVTYARLSACAVRFKIDPGAIQPLG